jgi:hypothetical protein
VGTRFCAQRATFKRVRIVISDFAMPAALELLNPVTVNPPAHRRVLSITCAARADFGDRPISVKQ